MVQNQHGFKPESVEAINVHFVRAPFDAMKREARKRKIQVEGAHRAWDQLLQAQDSNMSPEDAQKLLESVHSSILSLLDDMPQEGVNLARCKDRAKFVKKVAEESRSCAQWNRQWFPLLLTNYMLQEGCYSAAVKLSQHISDCHLCDWHVFSGARDVLQSLQQRDSSVALQWCNQNACRLKQNSLFAFQLHVLRFLGLLEAEQTVKALEYARKHLSAFSSTHFSALKSVVALLVLGKKTGSRSYASRCGPESWSELSSLFLRELLLIHNVSEVSLLELQLQAGLSALKCPQSFENSAAREDPLHSTSLRELARDVPWSKHIRSKLVCAMSSSVMDESSPPLVLPNGYVYGKTALQAAASEAKGKVQCITTRQTFSIGECVPAFIM
jgi:macrophage erythroblast attacher